MKTYIAYTIHMVLIYEINLSNCKFSFNTNFFYGRAQERFRKSLKYLRSCFLYTIGGQKTDVILAPIVYKKHERKYFKLFRNRS